MSRCFQLVFGTDIVKPTERILDIPNRPTAPAVFGRISSFYDGLVQTYGHDPKACDYGRAESQIVKFRVLADVSPLSNKSVLDVGCGFADFSGYLNERYSNVKYSGVDLSGSMIREAQRCLPDVDVRVGNILDIAGENTVDVVTANGIFYLLEEEAPRLMQTLVNRMFALCRMAVAFNSLSSWAPDQEAGEFYADPLQTLSWCRALSPFVVLRHDYHSRDFTVYIYKGPIR
jgi:SAM-dependent methyltransferase